MNKWHQVFNDGVPYNLLSPLQKEEIRKEYPTLDLRGHLWARDADILPTETVHVAPIDTVNVIEICSDTMQVAGLKSFPDTPEGNKAAEEHFAACAKENGMADASLEDALDWGCWHQADYSLIICHST